MENSSRCNSFLGANTQPQNARFAALAACRATRTLGIMRITVAIAAGVLHLHCHSAPPADCANYGSELGTMVSVDQSLRGRWNLGDPSFQSGQPPRIVEQTNLVDRQNTERLKQLVRACGWPKPSVHGKAAVNDAWLLAQHADHDRPFQAMVVKYLEKAVAAGEAPGGQLAYLSDRLSVASGKPQLYGTQLDLKPPCGVEFFALDDRDKVEQRRKALKLPPLEEYRNVVLRETLPPNCSAP